MSTTFRYGHTKVYSDATVIDEETDAGKKPAPGARLLFSYNFAEPDHGYVRAGQGSLELKFEQGVSAGQLRKVLVSPSIDPDARHFVERRIKQNNFSSGSDSLRSLR